LLRPEATKQDYIQLCDEAKQFGFAAVCVPPVYVALAKKNLAPSKVKLATVIGFPLGYQTIESKVFEIEQLSMKGVDEFDVVINVSKLKAGDDDYLNRELGKLRKACGGSVLKTIIETALLDDDEKKRIAEMCAQHGIDYVKTSSGWASKGATVDDVTLLRAVLPKEVLIKASGGIKTAKFAKQLLEAGAERLGCSGSVQIVSS